MSKMMLTPGAGHTKVSPADLLGQLGTGRSAPGGAESPTGFAQLLQAKAGSMNLPLPATAAGKPPAQVQAQSRPPAPRPAPGTDEGKAGERADAADDADPSERAGPASTAGARRQDNAKAAMRRPGEAQGKAAQPTGAQPQADSEIQDPVLAQVLRQLRADESEAGEPTDAALAQADPSLVAGQAAPAPSQVPALLQPAQGGSAAQAATPAEADALATPDGASRERQGALASLGEGAEPGGGPAGHTTNGLLAPAMTRGGEPGAVKQDALQALALASAEAAGRELLATEGQAREGIAPAGGFASVLQHAQANAVQGRNAPQGADARYDLQAPLHSSGFAPEMSARLSLAAAEGVQQAQLHLNPAEMGPVQVQIVLDGQQAQISFVAEQAETRSVLEKSLPELAGALREQGLTLSGGGVFSQQQQAQSGQSEQDGHQGARWAGASLGAMEGSDPAAAQERLPAATRSRGVLDLFA